jgi:hypothetical protein
MKKRQLCNACDPPKMISKANFLRHTRELHEGERRGGRGSRKQDEDWTISPEDAARFTKEDDQCSESVLPEYKTFLMTTAGGNKNDKEADACTLMAARFLAFARRFALRHRQGEMQSLPYHNLDILSCDLRCYSAWINEKQNRLMRSLLPASRAAALQRIKQ